MVQQFTDKYEYFSYLPLHGTAPAAAVPDPCATKRRPAAMHKHAQGLIPRARPGADYVESAQTACRAPKMPPRRDDIGRMPVHLVTVAERGYSFQSPAVCGTKSAGGCYLKRATKVCAQRLRTKSRAEEILVAEKMNTLAKCYAGRRAASSVRAHW